MASAGTFALGLGNGPASIPLGQSLDISVPVRLEADESLEVQCVQVDVLQGEQRIAPASIRTRVSEGAGGSAVIRISSPTVIDEPVVTVAVAAGCPARVNRRYTLFAEPVLPAPSPVAPVVAAVSTLGPPAPRAATDSPSAPRAATDSPSAPRAAAAADRGPARSEAPRVPRSARSVAPAPRAAARERGTRVASARAPRERRARALPDRPPAPAPQLAALARAPAQPRLRLEPVDAPPVPMISAAVIEEALEAVAQAASAARQAADAASASMARAAALESTVERMHAEARASQAELERLRALAQRPQLSGAWSWPLLGLLALVSLLAVWLAWRLRALQRTQEMAWTRASTLVAAQAPPGESSPMPLMASNLAAPSTRPHTGPGVLTPMGGPLTQPAVLPAEAEPMIDPATARTAVLPRVPRVEEERPRDVSIEELIDVDQQAEFFIALGQDQAAVELLVAHLRDTGGGSPLTYLKLLEIYRRIGDEAAYERTRSRFNHRYNAYAPEWGSDLTHGRSLEDYPGVVPRLQQAWSRPLDAMAELEALLFRKSRGELFELPAYRDVLFLYSLARDLMDHDANDPGAVDVLLPLDARAAAVGAVGSARAEAEVPFDERPTAPVDLDLTPPPTAGSIFAAPLVPSPGIPRGGRS